MFSSRRQAYAGKPGRFLKTKKPENDLFSGFKRAGRRTFPKESLRTTGQEA